MRLRNRQQLGLRIDPPNADWIECRLLLKTELPLEVSLSSQTSIQASISSSACQLGLSVGESFAEVVCAKPSFRSRWPLAKKSLTDGLREAIEAIASGSDAEVRIASSVVERSLKKGQGQSPAFIVASGFESWFAIRQSCSTPVFTLEPKREEPRIEKDFIFGISGRLKASDGSEESPIRIEELEFLKSKLELLKIKHLVVALPHADRNPEHENQVARYFEEQGFKTFLSHSLSLGPNDDPVVRWTELAELAYAGLAVEEERAQIEAAGEKLQLTEWLRVGHGIRGGIETALLASATSTPTLHLGLDHFYLVRDGRIQSLGLSASQGLKMGEWSFPDLSEQAVGLEPGPMLFGKSQLIAILDILFVLNRLQPIEGLTALINEKSRARILETLLAWGKTAGLQTGGSRLDPMAIAEDIELCFIDRLAQDALLGLRGRVNLQGALASTLAPLLKKRRPDLDLSLNTDAEWSEALACLATTPEVRR